MESPHEGLDFPVGSRLRLQNHDAMNFSGHFDGIGNAAMFRRSFCGLLAGIPADNQTPSLL